MADNPYEILGVNKDATEKEIKSAYRELAKQYHPDLHPEAKGLTEKFAKISSAYHLLLDKEKRAAFDRGEIDSSGQATQHHYYRDFAEGNQGQRYNYSQNPDAHHFSSEDIENIFGSFFRGGKAGEKAGFKSHISDSYYSIEIDFLEAALGTKKHITLPDGKVLNLTIPAGLRSGQRLRLKGQGGQGSATMPAGDAYIDVHVRPHPLFRRVKQDIYMTLAITIYEAALGAKIEAPTIHGPVTVHIPKGSRNGAKMRLKGKGIRDGDHYIQLELAMPEQIDEVLLTLLKQWEKNHPYSPRNKKGGA